MGETYAYSIIANVAAGGVTANVSLALATLKSEQEAVINTKARMHLQGDVSVVSKQNWLQDSHFIGSNLDKFTATLNNPFTDEKGNNHTGTSKSFKTMAEAFIISASVGGLSINANTAAATANATGIARVQGDDLEVGGSLNVESYGVSIPNTRLKRKAS